MKTEKKEKRLFYGTCFLPLEEICFFMAHVFLPIGFDAKYLLSLVREGLAKDCLTFYSSCPQF